MVLAAGAIESARLLMDSASDRHPGGLGNDTDQVGRHLQGHAYGGAAALFAEQVVDLRGPGVDISTTDHRHGNDGIIGGGILADEFVPTPASTQRELRQSGLLPANAPVGSPTMERAMLRLGKVVGPIQEVTSADSRVQVNPVPSGPSGPRDRAPVRQPPRRGPARPGPALRPAPPTGCARPARSTCDRWLR